MLLLLIIIIIIDTGDVGALSLVFPTVSSSFEFQFERQNATKHQLKALINAEASSFHEERYGKSKMSSAASRTAISNVQNGTSTGVSSHSNHISNNKSKQRSESRSKLSASGVDSTMDVQPKQRSSSAGVMGRRKEGAKDVDAENDRNYRPKAFFGGKVESKPSSLLNEGSTGSSTIEPKVNVIHGNRPPKASDAADDENIEKFDARFEQRRAQVPLKGGSHIGGYEKSSATISAPQPPQPIKKSIIIANNLTPPGS